MIPYRKVAFYTLGCKLNFSETSSVSRLFEEGGYAKVDFEERADIYVINTCSVTDHADSKCRNVIRKALSRNPEAFVAITGCYAQLKPEEIAGIPGVDLVLGTGEKFDILSHLESIEKVRDKGRVVSAPIKNANTFTPAYSFGDRTRSFLKVQDGCDYFCSFCTIPLARGKSRSGSIAQVVEKAEEIAGKGIREIVLTGVNTGDFGNGWDEDFLRLIRTLDEVSGVARFRISSIEPNLLSDEIIEFVTQSGRFMPHFHLPLQSASDRILQKMRRKYRSALYRQRVEKIKALMPHCCIGADVIAGFPGETHEDFLDTYRFLNELEISYLHVFPYSERQNTGALKITEKVPTKAKEERSNMLRNLSEKKKREFYSRHMGQVRATLFEAGDESHTVSGFTDNYIRVKLPFQTGLIGSLRPVRLVSIGPDGILTGEPAAMNESTAVTEP